MTLQNVALPGESQDTAGKFQVVLWCWVEIPRWISAEAFASVPVR